MSLPGFRSTFELTDDEIALARSHGLDPEKYIAITEELEPCGVEVRESRAPGQPSTIFAVFAVTLDARAFRYSKMMDGQGRPMRGPLDGLMVKPSTRIIIPQANVTPHGIAIIEQAVVGEVDRFRKVQALLPPTDPPDEVSEAVAPGRRRRAAAPYLEQLAGYLASRGYVPEPGETAVEVAIRLLHDHVPAAAPAPKAGPEAAAAQEGG